MARCGFLVSFGGHSAIMFQFHLISDDFLALISACMDATVDTSSLVAGAGHTLLDLDKPLCYLGITTVLRRLLPALGGDYLVRIPKPPVSPTAPHPVIEDSKCVFCTAHGLMH